MRRCALEDLHEADMIESEVSVFCMQAKSLLDMAWERVAEGVQKKEGRAGCLQGQVEDYVQSIDEMIATKDAAFAKNRNVLQQRINSGGKKINKLISTIQDQVQTVQANMDKLMSHAPNRVELQDVKNLRGDITESEHNFRWAPSMEYLEALDEPLRLIAIKTRAMSNGLNSAIQLVFSNGLESPMYDAEHPSSGEIMTARIKE